jgi:UDP-perosamine 4-acetyltransferase
MNMQPMCIIIGGGGHAHVLIDCLQLTNAAQIYGVLDPDQSRWGQMLLDVPIVGNDDLLAEMKTRGVDCFAIGLGGVGNNRPRQKLFELAQSYGLRPLTIKHPAATISRWATIGEGCQCLASSVVNAGATLGVNVIVNSGAIVEHDCAIGSHVHISTGAKVASTVQVGDGAHIGAGSTIRQSITIGAGAIVGAGAVVVKDVAPWTIVAGVPARVLRAIPTEATA